MPRGTVEDLRGQDAEYNAAVARRILSGEPGHVRNTVLLNAASALMALDEAPVGSFQERMAAAIEGAAQSLDTGAAQQVLDRWIAHSRC